MHWWRTHRRTRRVVVSLLLLALVGWAIWASQITTRIDLWLHGEQPIQFYLSLDGDLLDDYSEVIVVAHNSGDRVTTTREALAHGAEVIEIDVVSVSGGLYAAHAAPPPFITRHIYQGPPLYSMWVAAAEAEAIKLDLKETSPRYVNLVIRFLTTHHTTDDERRVIASTRNRYVLESIHTRAPNVILLLSVGTPAQFDALTRDPALVEMIDGVTIRHTLVDEERMMWLRENGLITFAWTVNDLSRTNELVKLGVNGITTDNLAIMELLGGRPNGEDQWTPDPDDEASDSDQNSESTPDDED